MLLAGADVDKLFESIDSDKNGAINYTEFLASSMEINLANNEKLLKEAFNFFDKDKNGTIEREEIKVAAKMSWVSEKELTDIMNQVDKNGDGKVIYYDLSNADFLR